MISLLGRDLSNDSQRMMFLGCQKVGSRSWRSRRS